MYEAFISFKNLDENGNQTRDSQIAAQIYSALRARGVEVFFSNEEVKRKSRPDYGDLIDEALEDARVLILIGTNPGFVKAKWVEYEWRIFNNEIHSGRKNGKILTVLEGMSVGELPIAVRHWEAHLPQQLNDICDMVCGILGKAAPAARPTAPVTAQQPVRKAQPQRSNITVGSRVTFGSYPQSSSTPEPITWRVLAVERGRAVMISESILDCKKYNESFTRITWEGCTLRHWLNNEFYNTAFSLAERNKIFTVRNENPDNPSDGTKGGNSTEDKVYCLSIDEVKRYFSDTTKEQNGYITYPDRMAKPTAYARQNGCYVYSDWGTGWWWLRSPGIDSDFAADVLTYGYINDFGYFVIDDNNGVRPVVSVSL